MKVDKSQSTQVVLRQDMESYGMLTANLSLLIVKIEKKNPSENQLKTVNSDYFFNTESTKQQQNQATGATRAQRKCT